MTECKSGEQVTPHPPPPEPVPNEPVEPPPLPGPEPEPPDPPPPDPLVPAEQPRRAAKRKSDAGDRTKEVTRIATF
jgi:hypothetical protein